MADTTVKIDSETRDRFAAIAAAHGQSMRAYLAELAQREENQQKLSLATVAFERAISRPGFAEAFDRDFGGLPATPSAREAA